MSEKMYTEKEYLEGIRGATGERAVWFYLLMKEAEKLGVNPDDICKEERKEICRLACYGDYGRVDCAQGVKLDFAQKCAHDDEVCELVFTKK